MAYEGNNRKRNSKFGKQDGFEDQVLDLRRVVRVTAGGKRFRFRATVVVGDGKGTVGIGVAKGPDVPAAIEKAKNQAKNSTIKIGIKNNTIAHEVEAKFSAARILIKPASTGHGLMVGGSPRVVLKLAGIQDATAKCLGRTKNKLTNAHATIEALKKLKE